MLIGYILSRPRVVDWLIERAKRTPYFHLPGYMERYWLFNAYGTDDNVPRYKWCPWSIRLHLIKRGDGERHQHNHPWNARSYILRGWYLEQRGNLLRKLVAGQRNMIKASDFHSINGVSDGGVWTIFITGPKLGSWGFLIPWDDYERFPARLRFGVHVGRRWSDDGNPSGTGISEKP